MNPTGYLDPGSATIIGLLVLVPLAAVVTVVVLIVKSANKPRQAPPPMLAGWSRDPYGRYPQRWWDGARWTDQVIDQQGQQGTDPAAPT